MSIVYTGISKNSIKEVEHIHKLFIQALIWSWTRENRGLFNV